MVRKLDAPRDPKSSQRNSAVFEKRASGGTKGGAHRAEDILKKRNSEIEKIKLENLDLNSKIKNLNLNKKQLEIKIAKYGKKSNIYKFYKNNRKI